MKVFIDIFGIYCWIVLIILLLKVTGFIDISWWWLNILVSIEICGMLSIFIVFIACIFLLFLLWIIN